MADQAPLPAEDTGKAKNGRFKPGNRAGKGNPLNRRAQMLRAQCLRYADPKKIWDVIEMLHTKAIQDQDVVAAKEWLDRTLGKAAQPIEVTGDVRHSHTIDTSGFDEVVRKRMAARASN